MEKYQIDQLIAQIGKMNIWAISGGRVGIVDGALVLPVGKGYKVIVELNGKDYYDVKRVYGKANKVKGVVKDVDCFQIGEIAYQASCFVNVKFGEVK